MQLTEDHFTGRSSYSAMLGDQLMEDLETPILLSQCGAFLSPSVVAFRPKAGVKGNLIGQAKKCCRVLREVADAGSSPSWLEGGLAKGNTQIHQAPMRPRDREHRGVGKGKDAEFCKLGQKTNERRNGKQDSAAS